MLAKLAISVIALCIAALGALILLHRRMPPRRLTDDERVAMREMARGMPGWTDTPRSGRRE